MDTKHPNSDDAESRENVDDIDLDREFDQTSDSVVDENNTTEDNAQTDTGESEDTTSESTVDDTQAIKDAIAKDVAATAPTSRAANLNKYFLYTLVAGLIISALISIVAVLVGEFNSTMARALGTTVSMVGHTLVALLIVSVGSRHKKGGSLILSALLTITIASFITSILAIWQIIKGGIIGDLYGVYFYTFCAVLWIQLLLKIGKNALDKATHATSLVGVGFTALFYALLVPTVFIHYPNRAAEFHLRALAAAAIALATVSVLAIVFHRIHLFKHPEDKEEPSNKSHWTTVIIILVVFFLGIPAAFGFISSLVLRNNIENRYRSPSPSPLQTPISKENQRLSDSVKSDQTSVDCADLPRFQSPRVMRYVSNYTFRSTDTIGRTLTVSYQGSSQSMTPISYQGTLMAVDADCNDIDIDTIEPGDTVRLYLRTGYSNFYKDALAFVQKVN